MIKRFVDSSESFDFPEAVNGYNVLALWLGEQVSSNNAMLTIQSKSCLDSAGPMLVKPYTDVLRA